MRMYGISVGIDFDVGQCELALRMIYEYFWQKQRKQMTV